MEHQTCPIDRAAPRAFPPQHQDRQPGLEYQMDLRPISECAQPQAGRARGPHHRRGQRHRPGGGLCFREGGRQSGRRLL